MRKDIGMRQCIVLHLEKCKYKVRGMNIMGNNVGETDRNYIMKDFLCYAKYGSTTII